MSASAQVHAGPVLFRRAHGYSGRGEGGSLDVLGLTRARNCCTFLWVQDERQSRRLVLARAHHCATCVAEMVRSAKLQRIAIAGSVPMDGVRDALAKQKEQLIGRWSRQLRAAAEGGFALDGATAEVLPALLEAADRALHRRFRLADPAAPAAAAEAQRAAVQCSLLRDFLSDAMLEANPGMSLAEQRLLGDALAHAGVEVLVRRTLEREHQRRRREAMRLARLAHELRNSATAARLAMDLLRRRNAIRDSRAGRLLESSLSALREGIEDTLLDEALSAGGSRASTVRLAPMLQRTQSAALELGAAERNVRVVVARPDAGLSVRADPRVVRPAMRGMLRAALQVACAGATIQVRAGARNGTARVDFGVSGCRKLPGNRLPDLLALSLARRAAKASGGLLSARLRRDDGCDFHLALPRAEQQ